jgi:hypothetical protein
MPIHPDQMQEDSMPARKRPKNISQEKGAILGIMLPTTMMPLIHRHAKTVRTMLSYV